MCLIKIEAVSHPGRKEGMKGEEIKKEEFAQEIISAATGAERWRCTQQCYGYCCVVDWQKDRQKKETEENEKYIGEGKLVFVPGSLENKVRHLFHCMFSLFL